MLCPLFIFFNFKNQFIMYTNEEIHALLPFSFQEAEGEPTLLERLQPVYQERQKRADLMYMQMTTRPQGVQVDFVSQTEADIARLAVIRENLDLYAVFSATAGSLHSMDLALTPNGFAVVSTDNLAPASQERVRALHQELTDKAEHFRLLAEHTWFHSEIFYRWHRSTRSPWVTPYDLELLFDEMSLPASERLDARLNAHRLQESVRILFGEDVIDELMLALYWDDSFTGAPNYTDDTARRRQPYAHHILMTIAEAIRGRQSLFTDAQTERLTDAIARDIDLWQEWIHSTAYKDFKGNRYENKKSAGGYFF